MPALRERREDIPLLANHFLVESAERHRKRITGITPAAFAALNAPPVRPSTEAGAQAGRPVDLRDARAAFEAQFIADQLRSHGGNVSRTAVAIGISRVMLQKKMKDYGLNEKQ